MTLCELAEKIARFLAVQRGLPDQDVDSLRFGLEIIIGGAIKGFLLFTAAWALKIIPEVAVALLIGSTLRLLAGGAHCKSYISCLLFGSAVYLTVGILSKSYGEAFPTNISTFLIVAVYCSGCLAVLIWAPGKSPGVELSPDRRRKFKVLSLLYLQLWLLGLMGLLKNGSESLALAGLLAAAAQVFSLTPLGYRLLGSGVGGNS